MQSSPHSFYEKCSFLTQSVLIGWSGETTPIYARAIDYYGEDKVPKWQNWQEVQNTFIAPLCATAIDAYLFREEWRYDVDEVRKLRKFLDDRFKNERRYEVCHVPLSLVDSPLFWIGSNELFNLVCVLTFSVSNIINVLEILKNSNHAGKVSPRYGGVFSRANNLAKSSVKRGLCAMICAGHEFEIFFPMECKKVVEGYAHEVEQKRLSEARMVKQRILGNS